MEVWGGRGQVPKYSKHRTCGWRGQGGERSLDVNWENWCSLVCLFMVRDRSIYNWFILGKFLYKMKKNWWVSYTSIIIVDLLRLLSYVTYMWRFCFIGYYVRLQLSDAVKVMVIKNNLSFFLIYEKLYADLMCVPWSSVIFSANKHGRHT